MQNRKKFFTAYEEPNIILTKWVYAMKCGRISTEIIKLMSLIYFACIRLNILK